MSYVAKPVDAASPETDSLLRASQGDVQSDEMTSSREQRVSAIKDQVRSGSYLIDPQKIADSIWTYFRRKLK